MGNQPSKGSEAGTEKSAGPLLDAYPSFSKSDTKESTRSLRGSIKSKIPGGAGSGKTDSPRTSTSMLSPASDSQEPEGSRSPSDASASAKTPLPIPALDLPREDSVSEDLQPPPSPTQSASVGKGHSSINRAQQSGEVDHVSDAPPTGMLHPSHHQQPGVSILMKTPQPSPRSRSKLRSLSRERPSRKSMSRERHFSTTDGSMEIGALKSGDLDEMIQRLLDAGYAGKVTKAVCLKNAEIDGICKAIQELMLSQPSLLELSPPVKIVGDIHGQYTDLLRLFEMCGFPPDSNYLFLGDYVDRGKQSLETILLLMCYKLKFPENFFLLRGNHESANVTRVYGFYDECKRRCNVKVWKNFIDAFNTLPIASIVAGKIFCVHGGLSPSLKELDDIREISRPTDVPDYGLLNDLLWSDPADMDGDFGSNERGVSYCFSKRVIMDFLQKNDFDLVCRAHMVVEDGYEFFNDRILVTVFSAPNVSP